MTEMELACRNEGQSEYSEAMWCIPGCHGVNPCTRSRSKRYYGRFVILKHFNQNFVHTARYKTTNGFIYVCVRVCDS